MTTFESPEARNARELAEIRAHEHYEAVKALNPDREPSELELAEYAESKAFADQPKAQKIAHGLDELLGVCEQQARHGGPVSGDIIRRVKEIRAFLV